MCGFARAGHVASLAEFVFFRYVVVVAASWLSHQIRINSCGTVLCEADWSWHPRPGNGGDYDLWFVWAGRGQMAFEGRSIDLAPGDVFCLRPTIAYDATHDPRHRLGVCYLHFDFVQGGRIVHPAPAALPPHHCRLREVELYERMLRQAVILASAPTASALEREQATLLVKATLLAMQASCDTPPVAAAAREQDERIRAVMRQIREEPGRMYSVEELASSAAYSADHFTRLFRAVAGVTPKEYCIRARLERAQVLLVESPMSIEQIATNLGYADVFFFSRQFKQRFGISPSAWRRQQTAPQSSGATT